MGQYRISIIVETICRRRWDMNPSVHCLFNLTNRAIHTVLIGLSTARPLYVIQYNRVCIDCIYCRAATSSSYSMWVGQTELKCQHRHRQSSNFSILSCIGNTRREMRLLLSTACKNYIILITIVIYPTSEHCLLLLLLKKFEMLIWS